MHTKLGPGKHLASLFVLGVAIVSLFGYTVGARIALINNSPAELTNPVTESTTQTLSDTTPTVIPLDTGDFSEEAPAFGPPSHTPQSN
jgi:hypothetical protein